MPTLTTLAIFNTADGKDPTTGLVADAAGNLFGTAGGGAYAYGTLFEIARSGGGYASTPTTFSFNYPNGIGPNGGLIADAAGNLFGTTGGGGANNGDGTVFEIAKTSGGYASVPTTLVTFNYTDGAGPIGGLIADAAGNLFGTTDGGGANNGGTLFEIAKTSGGYASAPTTLVNFGSAGQGFASNGLIADAAGDLFGTTEAGGPYNLGTVFEFAKTSSGYASTPTTLATFNGSDGELPVGRLTTDAAGNLFGITTGGNGTVFEIAKTPGGYASTPTTLVDFGSLPIPIPTFDPSGGLIADAAGNLFGTTELGGPGGDGTVFEIAKTGAGYASTPTTLVNFNTTNGAGPNAPLIADAAGNLFGTTEFGGAYGVGSVFELSGTGFQVACYLRGTRIATPTGERAIESLAEGELVLTGSGEARPVVWTGHRHVDCRLHPTPQDVWPVRVRADAFGPGMPHRDLFLSPDHAVFVDGWLIPVRYLINGATVVQEPADNVTYWHVELDRHDVILAEGLPCETYLDTGNRGAFANGGAPVQMHPDFALRIWDAEACAPLVLGGPRLIAAKRRLLAQAARLGHTTCGDPGLKVLVDGAAVPAEAQGRLCRVRLPEAAERVRLISRVWSPAQMRPDGEDTRSLGIAISRIRLDGREVSLESQGISTGWHAPEPGWRWTDGDAGLALSGVRELAFEVVMVGTYWQDKQRRQVLAA